MASGNKSGGTLSVSVVAETSSLDAGLKAGQESGKRFAKSYTDHAAGVSRASDSMARSSILSAEKASRAFGVASGGLMMMAGSAEGAAGTIGGVLTRSIGALAAGGPIAGGVTLLADVFNLAGKHSREAAAGADRLREVQARLAAEAKAASEARRTAHASALAGLRAEIDALARRNELETDRVARVQGARLAAAGDADFAAGRDLTGPTAASTARALNRAENEAARARKFNDEMAAGQAQSDARADGAIAAGRAWTDRKVAAREQLEEAVRLASATDAQRKHWSEIQRIGELRRLDMHAEAEIAEELLATTIKREAAEKAAAEAKRRGENQGRTDADAARRVRDLQATTELERIINRHADERNALAAQGVRLGETLLAQGFELAKFKTAEANEAERVRAAMERQAEAQADAVQQARYFADEQKRAADAAQTNTFGGGYGPLAQARDAKRRNRNIDRFKNHADNLAAEKRETSAYGNVGANQYDANGNPVGIADPFAFDLGSIMERRRAAKPEFPNAAPGLFQPAYQFPDPAAPGMGGGDALGGPTFAGPGTSRPTTPTDPGASDMRGAAADMKAASDAAEKAAADTEAAADATTEAAGSVEALATATRDLASTTGTAFNNVKSIAEEALQIAREVQNALASASYFG